VAAAAGSPCDWCQATTDGYERLSALGPQRSDAIGRARAPIEAGDDHPRYQYQFYFATERGIVGYEKYRYDFAKLIWKSASPNWNFDDATFARTAAADGASYRKKFTGRYSHRFLERIGHNVPQEAPQAFAQAILDVDGY
jgi:hypothetical protein